MRILGCDNPQMLRVLADVMEQHAYKPHPNPPTHADPQWGQISSRFVLPEQGSKIIFRTLGSLVCEVELIAVHSSITQAD